MASKFLAANLRAVLGPKLKPQTGAVKNSLTLASSEKATDLRLKRLQAEKEASMHPMSQLDQLRRQMAEELTQIPQYRALKSMERFIAELSAIYETPVEAVETGEGEDSNRKIGQAIESHLRGEAGPTIVKNAAYLPVHRVA
jgi:hypothetical protein